jgi:hypothetical protein
MYKVKIFFGSFYGEWFENDFLEDMDWSDISVAECMIEAHFPVVPAHGSIVDVSSLRSQIYKGWKKYVDAGGYLSDVIDGLRNKFKIPRQIPNADIFKEMVFGGNYLQDFISYKNYTVGTDEDVFYGVCLTPNTDYIKIEIY